MEKIKIELWFDDKESVKELFLYGIEFEQLIHNKELISDGKEYLVGKCVFINEKEKNWFRIDCFLKGGLRSQSSFAQK